MLTSPMVSTAGRNTRVLVVLGDPGTDAFALTASAFFSAARRHPEASQGLSPVFLGVEEVLAGGPIDADVVLGLDRRVADLPARLRGLRWVHVLASGVDGLLPFDWLPGNVAITNSRGAHRVRTAEFARLALLMLAFRIPQYATRQRRHEWVQDFTAGLPGQKLVVVGLGSIGSEVARAGWEFGMEVIGVRRSQRPARHVHRLAAVADLPGILPVADMLVLAAPLTPVTAGMIGPRELSVMKPTAGLVNLGRAGLIDTAALTARLEHGGLAAAILDVFDEEPLPAGSALWDVPNLTILPHVSVTDAAHYLDLMLDVFFDNLFRFRSGKALRNRVSRKEGY